MGKFLNEVGWLTGAVAEHRYRGQGLQRLQIERPGPAEVTDIEARACRGLTVVGKVNHFIFKALIFWEKVNVPLAFGN